MQKGNINVQSENIFPIIKKFLYSDQEIFLRELISNSIDATKKIKSLSSIGEYDKEVKNLRIEVSVDEKNKTLTVSDQGVGMTEEELDKYINQIAFSSAEDFVQKFKEKDPQQIIGQFGLGFYSAFMVADKVEIQTLSYQKNAEPVKWECSGTTEYKITKGKRKSRGTDVILHINEESKDYLNESKIQELLDKYCKFLPIPIKFGEKEEKVEKTEEEKQQDEKKSEEMSSEDDKKEEEKTIKVDNIINNTEPAWIKSPEELTEEDYKNFYKELYPLSEDPLFHIHLNVDFPFNLTGILYFPKIRNNLEIQKNKIQLYCNQVYVTDSVEQIVPDFLTLLHGVLDSPDIPLNVSRSYLQSDKNVKKISNHITKKVADKLHEMFKNDREDFQKKWDDIKVFIEYGMLTDDKFMERVKDFALYKDTDDNYYTFEEYKKQIENLQTDKDNKTVILYSSNKDEQYNFIQAAKDKGYSVLVMDSPLTSHLVTKLEQEYDNVSFARVDADTLDNLINKDEEKSSKLSEDEQEKLKPVFEENVDKEKFTVTFNSMSEKEDPIVITQSEFMRRMKEQQMTGGGGMQMMGNMPEMYNLVVNSNHPVIDKINNAKDDKEKKRLAKQAIDLGMLSQNMLKGEELNKFIKRSVDLIK